MGNNNSNNYVQFVIVNFKIYNKLKYYIVNIFFIQNVLINGWELIVNVHCVKMINFDIDEHPNTQILGDTWR